MWRLWDSSGGFHAVFTVDCNMLKITVQTKHYLKSLLLKFGEALGDPRHTQFSFSNSRESVSAFRKKAFYRMQANAGSKWVKLAGKIQRVISKSAKTFQWDQAQPSPIIKATSNMKFFRETRVQTVCYTFLKPSFDILWKKKFTLRVNLFGKYHQLS